jgi:hypothetical protein
VSDKKPGAAGAVCTILLVLVLPLVLAVVFLFAEVGLFPVVARLLQDRRGEYVVTHVFGVIWVVNQIGIFGLFALLTALFRKLRRN